MVRQIAIEAENPWRLQENVSVLARDASSIAEGLTAVQAHVLVGEILERITVPKLPGEPATATASDAAATPRRWSAGGGLSRFISTLGLNLKYAPTVNTAQYDMRSFVICNHRFTSTPAVCCLQLRTPVPDPKTTPLPSLEKEMRMQTLRAGAWRGSDWWRCYSRSLDRPKR